MSALRVCRECGIHQSYPGETVFILEGEPPIAVPLCWADDDLCARCFDRLQEAMERDAKRYRYIRNRRTCQASIKTGGIFAGRIPENLILGGEDLDRAIDGAMGGAPPAEPTLERRLGECLGEIIDAPLFTGRDEVGGFSSPLEIRLGFFRPELSERAAELLEEAGL